MRETLLDTAVDHFGRHGFEGAATRAIAKASGTAMSSITYHFGGKEGLYLAAAEHIAEQISKLQQPTLEAARAASPKNSMEAAEALTALLSGLALMMLSERTEKLARFVLREQQDPTKAFDIIYDVAMVETVETILHFIQIARPDLPEIDRRASAFLLVGQVLSMRSCRASMARVLQLPDGNDPRENAALNEKQVEALMLKRIGEHTHNILSAEPELDR